MNNRFRQACVSRGVSLATVARDIGCSVAELVQIEAGLIPIPPELAARLAEYLGDDHINDHVSGSYRDGSRHELASAERELLSCYRRMREGQKQVLSDLALMMAFQGRAGVRQGQTRLKEEGRARGRKFQSATQTPQNKKPRFSARFDFLFLAVFSWCQGLYRIVVISR